MSPGDFVIGFFLKRDALGSVVIGLAHPSESDSYGSNCYNCHMSYTTYGLAKAIRSHQIDSPDVATSLTTGRPTACNQCHLNQTLAWSAQHLSDWYGIPTPDLSKNQQTIAASVLWSLTGDAGQRALMAWSFGWDKAQQTSGTDWMVPCLAQLLIDPYDAVRLIAHRSLKSIGGFDSVEYDYIFGSDEDRETARQNVLMLWRSRAIQGQAADAVLIDADGQLDQTIFDRLVQDRDDRDVSLSE
ncbi:MAG TPA: hypothetical protein EYQ63_02460 [Fuerstia sp.]|nr:hypothetical protein [Fuerstiella sp.]